MQNSTEALVLELQGVGKAYGPRLLFKNVNLSVRRGELFLLVGANGAGKSTLMRIMAGLVMADHGKIAGDVKPAARFYLAHATFIYPGLSAVENLMFWSNMAGLRPDGQAVLDALKVMGLYKFAEEKAGTFSRGMAQRLNLARLLLGEARLLLLDEPETGLDQASRGLLHELIRQNRDRGAAVIWITHSGEDVLAADHILTLAERELRQTRRETS